MADWTCLHTHVWVLILSKLPTRDAFKKAAVCKRLRAILSMPNYGVSFTTVTGVEFAWFEYTVLSRRDLDWFPGSISHHVETGMEFFNKNPHIQMDTYGMSHNRNISKKDVVELGDDVNMTCVLLEYDLQTAYTVYNPEDTRHTYALNKNPNLNLQFVLSHPEIRWNWSLVSEAPLITIEDIRLHLHLKWDWDILTSRIHIKDIFAHPELRWNMKYISKNPTIDVEYVLAQPYCNLAMLSSNPAVKFENVNRHIDLNWCWLRLSLIIPVRDILEHPSLPWYWRNVCSTNKSITLQDIDRLAQMGKIIWTELMLNSAVGIKTIMMRPQYNWSITEYISLKGWARKMSKKDFFITKVYL